MFTHTPAYTIDMPDMYTNDEIGEVFTVREDCDMEGPLYWATDVEVYVYHQPSFRSSESPEGLFAETFDHYLDRTGDDDKALDLTHRYMRAFHDDKRVGTLHSITGYSQSAWEDILIVADNAQTADSFAKAYAQWFRGDVWIVTDENTGDSLGGIYADTPEEAIAEFLSY